MTANWAEEVMRITGGKGVDFVLDVGGAGTIENSLKSVRTGGLVSLAGILTPGKEIDLVPAILYGAKTGKCGLWIDWQFLQYVFANGVCLVVRVQLGYSKTMGDDLIRRVDAAKIHPAVARIFKWGEAKEAVNLLMSQSDVGKIVVQGVPAGSA